jgi:uncharacterized protein
VEAAVRRRFAGESSGHDWWHTLRVTRLARRLARAEGADPQVCELAALLHDVDDWKLAGGGGRAVRMLKAAGADAALAARVLAAVGQVSFKGAGVATPGDTLEARVVQDADRLDALGAVGVARAFAYGGSRGRALHDPAQRPVRHASFAAYRRSRGTTVNHFYEKLLLLKDRMQTRSGRALARQRHAFLVRFLERFLREWEGR